MSAKDHFHVFACWKNFLKKGNVSYFDSHRIIRIKFSPTAIKEAVKSSDNGTWYLIQSFSQIPSAAVHTISHFLRSTHEVIIIAIAFVQPCPPKPLVPKPCGAYPNQVQRIDKFNAGKPKYNVYKNHPLGLSLSTPSLAVYSSSLDTNHY